MSVTAPIFILIALGFLAVWRGIISREAVIGMGKFVLYFSVPALIFRALSQTSLDQAFSTTFMLAYGAGGVVCFLLVFVILKLTFKSSTTKSGIGALGSAAPNSIFVGFPILAQILDTVSTSAFSMALIIENLLIVPIGLIVMDIGANSISSNALAGRLRATAIQLIKNPLLGGIVLGLLASTLQIQLPTVVGRAIDLLAQASAPIALFYIGGMLVGTKLKGQIPIISLIAAGKLLLHPLMVLAALALLPPVAPELELAAVILAAAPMLTIYPVIAARYDFAEEGAGTLLLTTAASFVTLSTILWLVAP